MIQTAELLNIPSKSNSILLLDAYYRYTSSTEMKIESSPFPPCTSSKGPRGSISPTAGAPSYPASTVSDYVSRQKPTTPVVSPDIFSMHPSIPETTPSSKKTFDSQNYRSASPDHKVTSNTFTGFSQNEFEEAGGDKATSGFTDNNVLESFLHCRNGVSRGRQRSIGSDVTLVDIGDVNVHTNDNRGNCRSNSQNNVDHLKERSNTSTDIDYTIPFILPPGALSGPSILLFEENPVLKFALNSKDPMVKYLNKALIEIVDQAFENDNTWTMRRIEWIETIKSVKKELEKHKQDKMTLKQKIKSLTLAYEIIKKEVEKVKQENFIIQKELAEAREKILILEREKSRSQGKMMWNSIKTATMVGIGIVTVQMVWKKFCK